MMNPIVFVIFVGIAILTLMMEQQTKAIRNLTYPITPDQVIAACRSEQLGNATEQGEH